MKSIKNQSLALLLLRFSIIFSIISINAAPPNWSPLPNQEFNSQMVTKFQLTGRSYSQNPNDIIGAFVDNECSGVASPAYSGNITNSSSGATTQNVAVTGEGVVQPLDPFITIYPTSHDFGWVEFGYSSDPVTFEITNTGGSVAEVSIYVEGDQSNYFYVYNEGDYFLNPGQVHYVTVIFHPWDMSVGYGASLVVDGTPPCNSLSAFMVGYEFWYVEVTTSHWPLEGGQVFGGGTYISGSEVCIEAIPNPGYVFDRWEKFDCTGGTTIYQPQYCYTEYADWGCGPDWMAFFEPVTELELNVFLEGPYNGFEMNSGLSTLTEFPLIQPFNVQPWMYPGTESVITIPSPDIVDWILVELRETTGDSSTATPSTIVERKAGFIKKDGKIVDLNGNDNLRFGAEINDNLFVVIWHRNHLGIMSSIPLTKSGGKYIYDFSTESDKVFGGTSGFKEVGTGVWGMVGGDANADGTVDQIDRDIWFSEAGKSGYLPVDFNLDGQVNNPDKNDVWLPNQGYTSQVPKGEDFSCGDDLVDQRDGQVYKTVQIGSQCWMAENLNIGDFLSIYDYGLPSDNGIIEKLCYDNDSAQCAIYGGLYEWGELMQYHWINGGQGICPEGWHVPTDLEWCFLTTFLDPTVDCYDWSSSGTTIGAVLKSEAGWLYGGNGNNSSGFSALPAGHFYGGYGSGFSGKGVGSNFYISTAFGNTFTGYRQVSSSSSQIARWPTDLLHSYSVRCIKDTSAAVSWKCGDPITDSRDNEEYNTTQIGEQCWMTENLRATTYKNNVPIDYPGNNDLAWVNNTTGAYAWYNNDSSWKNIYGALYNWYAVNNSNGLCPTGWHIPSNNEWLTLTDLLGGASSPNGNKLKSCRQVNANWVWACETSQHPRWDANNIHNCTDNVGFSGLPGGVRDSDPTYSGLGANAFWWSSTEQISNPEMAWCRFLDVNQGEVMSVGITTEAGFSVRCLKD